MYEWLIRDYPRVVLTSDDINWDPHTYLYQDQKNVTTDYEGNIAFRNTTAREPLMVINSINCTTSVDATDITADDNVYNVLESHMNVPSTTVICDSTSRYENL